MVARAFVEHLISETRLDRYAGERALQAQQQSRQRIDTVLTELALLTTNQLREAASSYFQIPLVNADEFPIEPVDLPGISSAYLRQARLVPLRQLVDGCVLIALDDPFGSENVAKIAYWIERQTSARLARPEDLNAGLERLYPEPAASTTVHNNVEDQLADADDVQRLIDMASEVPTIKLVNRLISVAVSRRASDIHIEPMSDGIRVRYRIDGELAEVERLPPNTHAGITTRVKVLAKLDIAERRLPQDGRTSFAVDGREIDIRVSTTPTFRGESVVLRVLDRDAVNLSFPSLGLEQRTVDLLATLLSRPNGILLVTGPTGSGKTTTLYTALTHLNSVKRKIFSVEDPIEYELLGVNQAQVKPAIGLDFPHVLRSILRQDPDIIMIGEMRDTETARIGIQAALTGHLVLATLHTNSAAAAITRLLDMGIEDYLLASTINGVLAQRLVRRLCQNCSEPYDDPAQVKLISHEVGSGAIRIANLRKPVGCQDCNFVGYRGRAAIAEVLIFDDAIRSLIHRGITEQEIATHAKRYGMTNLRQSGLRKVLSGESTLDDVLNATNS